MEQLPKSITVDVHVEGRQLWAQVRELPGCFASGTSVRELQQSLIECVSLYLSEPGRPVQVDLSLRHDNGPDEIVATQKVAVCV